MLNHTVSDLNHRCCRFLPEYVNYCYFKQNNKEFVMILKIEFQFFIL